jgi:hydrogenase maturation protease
MEKTLIIGYGNPDRQDDGVAWHVLQAIAASFGFSPDANKDTDLIQINEDLDLMYLLQLVPELSERLSQYKKVCFVDAHTGDIPDEVRSIEIYPQFHRSPFTHHLTPESLLEICLTIYKSNPKALLVSVRGYEFDFSNELSLLTAKLIPDATKQILNWIK